MLIIADKEGSVSWACDLCRKPGTPSDLHLVWRTDADGTAQAGTPCCVVHDACLREFVQTRLPTDDEWLRAFSRDDVQLAYRTVETWDGYLATGPATVARISLSRRSWSEDGRELKQD